MAYKYKLNPVTGKLDLVNKGGEGGGGIANITSADKTITVKTNDDTVDLSAPSLKMLEGYRCGVGTGDSFPAKFCDLYWTDVNGAISHLPYFHCEYHYFGGSKTILYTADLCLIFGNSNTREVCNAIVLNECAYSDTEVAPNLLERYKISNLFKVDFIAHATTTSPYYDDPREDSRGFGHAVIYVDGLEYRGGNVHIHPVSALSILENNSNLCWFFLNPEVVDGKCTKYTPQGTIQPTKVSDNGVHTLGNIADFNVDVANIHSQFASFITSNSPSNSPFQGQNAPATGYIYRAGEDEGGETWVQFAWLISSNGSAIYTRIREFDYDTYDSIWKDWVKVGQDLTAGTNISIEGNIISATTGIPIKIESDDAANAILGGDWRIPTREDFQELFDNCVNEVVWDGDSPVGTIFYRNGNEIFFPFNTGRPYWTADVSEENNQMPSYGVQFFPSGAASRKASLSISLQSRNSLFTIRPVSPTLGVNLGLPSGLTWASSNLLQTGLSDNSGEPGDLYMWGETVSKPSNASNTTYKFYLGEGLGYSRYNKADGLRRLLPETNTSNVTIAYAFRASKGFSISKITENETGKILYCPLD